MSITNKQEKDNTAISVMIRIILIILTIGIMVFIFTMSAMDAENSSALSTSVGYAVGEVVVEGFDELPPNEQAEFAESIEHPLRKLAHFTEFAALGFLLIFDVYLFLKMSGWKRFLIALIIGLIYAASDELHQRLVSGRSGEIFDVLIDTGGVFTGCLIASLILLVFSYFHKKHHANTDFV